ncbi:MAG: ECF transporter S component [Clostridia bacterium]|nr:ECF transporter S component [Clostridia bacterium]
MNQNKSSIDTKKIVGIAMFTALAYAVTFVFRIPVMFLTFDAKDAVITIASLMYGPLSGVLISFMVAFIEFISISGTGVYGFIMNFASSAVFSAVASLVYKYKRNTAGAVIGFYAASLSMVAVMMCLNILVTPYYMAGDLGTAAARAEVIALLPVVILPFNIAKALLNSAFAMLLYKPVVIAMRKAKLLRGSSKFEINRSSVVMLITALVTLAAAVVIFVILK